MSKAKPFLKWAGGKSRIARQIADYFPENFNKYYEPFLGSGAVYFTVSPQKGILNDLNKYLIGTYEIVRDYPEDLLRELDKIHEYYHSLPSLDEKADYYYDARMRYNKKDKMDVLKAALFIFLNKAGFNGMYRENSKGEYNIPFGKHDKCLISDRENILEVSKNLKDITFVSGDYKDALSAAKAGDLIYLDPPYVPVSKTANFTQYQKEGFSFDEQMKLRDLAIDLHKRGCYVVISNSSCPKSRGLYPAPIFNIHTIEITRLIHRSKKVVPEIVVTNFVPEEHEYVK
jgi:DNA adenine methylase